MDRFACFTTFVSVVDKGGFGPAARHLNLSPTRITLRIQWLEDHLGARLLNRTTRKTSVTDAGKAFYQRCIEILGQVEEAEAAASACHTTVSGTVRLNTSPALADRVAAVISEYVRHHTLASFDLTITDRIGDLVEAGLDLAIHADELADSTMICRRIGYDCWSPCASPDYLRRRGEPSEPADLARHNCLIYLPHWGAQKWKFLGGTGCQIADVSGNLSSNDLEAIRAAALAGQGITLLPDTMVEPDLTMGRLIRILRNYSIERRGVLVAYPSRRQLSPKVRSFVDFAVSRFSSLQQGDADAVAREAETLSRSTRFETWTPRPPGATDTTIAAAQSAA